MNIKGNQDSSKFCSIFSFVGKSYTVLRMYIYIRFCEGDVFDLKIILFDIVIFMTQVK